MIVAKEERSKKQKTKFTSAKFYKMFCSSYIILRIQRLQGNSSSLDEVAHLEPPHHDLRCSQLLLISSLILNSNRTKLSISKGKNKLSMS